MFSSSTQNGLINVDKLPVFLRPRQTYKQTKCKDQKRRVPLEEIERGYECTFEDVSTYDKFVEYVKHGFTRPMTPKQIHDWLSKLYHQYLMSAEKTDKKNKTHTASQVILYDSILSSYDYDYRQLFEALRAVYCIANGKKEKYYTPLQIVSKQFNKKTSHTRIDVSKNNGRQFNKKQSHIQINSVPKNHDTRVLVDNYCNKPQRNTKSDDHGKHDTFSGFNKRQELKDMTKPQHLAHVIELGTGGGSPLDTYTRGQVSSMNRDRFDLLTKYGNTIALKNDGDSKGYIVGGGYEKASGMINADGYQSLLKGFSRSEDKNKTDKKTFNRMTEGLIDRLKNQAPKKDEEKKVMINNFVHGGVEQKGMKKRGGENKDLINIRTIRHGKSKRKAGIGGVF